MERRKEKKKEDKVMRHCQSYSLKVCPLTEVSFPFLNFRKDVMDHQPKDIFSLVV